MMRARTRQEAFPGGRGGIFSRPPTGEPPSEEDVAWRSVFYVSWASSADGNAYKPGDPIPYEEAVRQGIVDPFARPLPDPICGRCKGGKWFTNPRPKGHAYRCPCRFCQPCPVCDGRGRVKVPAA